VLECARVCKDIITPRPFQTTCPYRFLFGFGWSRAITRNENTTVQFRRNGQEEIKTSRQHPLLVDDSRLPHLETVVSSIGPYFYLPRGS